MPARPLPAEHAVSGAFARSRALHAGPGLSFEEHRCGRAPAAFGAEEAARRNELVFVRRGAFVRRVAGVERWADATRVHLFRRGEPYRVAHPLGGGDRCTLLALDDERLDEALRAAGGGLDEGLRSVGGGLDAGLRSAGGGLDGARRAPALDGLADGRLYALQARLEHAHALGDALEAGELALALLAGAARALLAGRAAPERAPRRAARQRHEDLARAAREIVARRLVERLTLADVAAELGCSPFHLARVFARATGVPLHRHRNRLRLALALERVARGERDLAAVALASGFASHSHMDDAFRRELGLPPSALRPAAAARLARSGRLAHCEQDRGSGAR